MQERCWGQEQWWERGQDRRGYGSTVPTGATEGITVTATSTEVVGAAMVRLAASAEAAGMAAAAVSDEPVLAGSTAISAATVLGAGGAPVRPRPTLRDAEATVSLR